MTQKESKPFKAPEWDEIGKKPDHSEPPKSSSRRKFLRTLGLASLGAIEAVAVPGVASSAFVGYAGKTISDKIIEKRHRKEDEDKAEYARSLMFTVQQDAARAILLLAANDQDNDHVLYHPDYFDDRIVGTVRKAAYVMRDSSDDHLVLTAHGSQGDNSHQSVSIRLPYPPSLDPNVLHRLKNQVRLDPDDVNKVLMCPDADWSTEIKRVSGPATRSMTSADMGTQPDARAQQRFAMSFEKVITETQATIGLEKK